MDVYLAIIALTATAAHIAATIRVYRFLKDKKLIREPFVLIRLNTFRYMNQYKEITRQETGKVGSLFYIWVISINIVLAMVVLYLIV